MGVFPTVCSMLSYTLDGIIMCFISAAKVRNRINAGGLNQKGVNFSYFFVFRSFDASL